MPAYCRWGHFLAVAFWLFLADFPNRTLVACLILVACSLGSALSLIAALSDPWAAQFGFPKRERLCVSQANATGPSYWRRLAELAAIIMAFVKRTKRKGAARH